MKVHLYTIVWLICLFASNVTVSAQSLEQQLSNQTGPDSVKVAPKRGPYTLVFSIGSGLSYYSTHLGVPAALEQTHVSRFGVPATLRAMWYPDHRLRIGLESGWTTMYSYRGLVGNETAHMYVSVVPVLLVFSMPLAWLSGSAPG